MEGNYTQKQLELKEISYNTGYIITIQQGVTAKQYNKGYVAY
jgi:hypothetical protein